MYDLEGFFIIGQVCGDFIVIDISRISRINVVLCLHAFLKDLRNIQA